jgi:hypothetical protein
MKTFTALFILAVSEMVKRFKQFPEKELVSSDPWPNSAHFLLVSAGRQIQHKRRQYGATKCLSSQLF